MQVNYHILTSTIIISYNGKINKIEISSPLGEKVIALIKEDRLDEIPELVDVELAISKYTKEKFVVVDGVVLSYGQPVHQIITDKILKFRDNDLPFDNLLNFWNNLRTNPSERAKNELYLFLEKNEFPLTPDGHFIAYKKVRKDFKDLHSGMFDNSPGSIPEMERSLVDDDKNNTCSRGLHIASYYYANDCYGSHSDTLVEVKVNPRDVVSIPTDYNNAKARCCRYEVIGVIEKPHNTITVDDEKYTSSNVDEIESNDTDEDLMTSTCAECNMPEELCECSGEAGEGEDTSIGIENTIRVGNFTLTMSEITETWFEIQVDGLKKRKPSRIPNRMKLIHIDDVEWYIDELYIKDGIYFASYDDDGKKLFLKFD